MMMCIGCSLLWLTTLYLDVTTLREAQRSMVYVIVFLALVTQKVVAASS